MGSVADNLRAYQWDCPEHNYEAGPRTINALDGAAKGCKNCLNAFIAYVLACLGVQMPQKREPGPILPMSSDISRHGAIYEKCRSLGHMIGDSIPPATGFCLMLFEFNGRQMEYICNAQRPDMIDLLAEFQGILKKEIHP